LRMRFTVAGGIIAGTAVAGKMCVRGRCDAAKLKSPAGADRGL
jgi:hypothetical protein